MKIICKKGHNAQKMMQENAAFYYSKLSPVKKALPKTASWEPGWGFAS